MPYIQLNDIRHPLRVGAMRVGAAADAELRLPGVADPAAAAVVEVGSDQSASIRRAHDAAIVLVNGVQLGIEPAALLHGDKIELGGQELLFGDDKKGGSTQYVPSLAGHKQGGAAGGNGAALRAGAPTAATGGLLRSLVDGREYHVGAMGVVIGRDAGCDVVVPSSEVSRRHAAIMPTGSGYELRDTSTNGVWLNGARIEGTATLGRGDVVRVGGEEFRFYADVATPASVGAPAVSAAAAPAPAAPAPAPSKPAVPPPAAPAPLVAPMADFEMAVPKPAMPEPATDPRPPAAAPASAPMSAPAPAAAPAAPSRGALATLDVLNEGLLKGQRFEIRHPLAHVGRGDHNDVVITEESVSDSHAKLQKREGRWFVSDVGSTNGTYVAGRRLESEQELTAGADLRFGGVKVRFQPLADRAEEGKGTRVIAGANLEAAKRAAPAPAPTRRPAPAATAPKAPEKKSSRTLVILLLVLVAAAAAYFLGIGR